MGKTNFQYDETGNTYYYVFLTFLGLVLFPSTYYSLVSSKDSESESSKKKSKFASFAKGTVYWEACREKATRITRKDPYGSYKALVKYGALALGWVLFALVIQRISQFDYEMANFDPYEILDVSYDATPKEIKKKYREMSLKCHPDKPTGNEKLFMKLTKAYDALTDETAKYNWEHYGNPDGPQAMQFGIGLPSWIVEEKNSIWVLGVYTMIFMIGLPTVVYYWWSNSIKFSGEQVLLDTTQLYYYFFHKTPQMMLKRIIMVLAASLEFERGHNQAIVERPTDNLEIPHLMKNIPNLRINNKEKPLCFGYSVKARTLLFAHLSRIPLPMNTLHLDRLLIVEKCPFLLHEMVNCICQLIFLAHARRIARLPSLDTIESTMRLSSLIVQSLWEVKSPFLQLPHIEEDQLKHFHVRHNNIKTLNQLAEMQDPARRKLLRSLTDDQYKDVMRVLAMLPVISLMVTTEVVDDEEQHVVTAGSIITVTVNLRRKAVETLMTGVDILKDVSDVDEQEDKESEASDIEEIEEINPEDPAEKAEAAEDEPEKKKAPVWKKPQKKKSAKKSGVNKGKSKAKAKTPSSNYVLVSVGANDNPENPPPQENASDKNKNNVGSSPSKKPTNKRKKAGEGSGGSEPESGSESDEAQSNVDNEEDEEAEWERFQKKMNKREKALEGKSRVSHSVHCPYFPEDKQEYWWCYIADRRNRALITPPYHVTSLIDSEDVELKFTAPQKPGHYNFTVYVRSDSYMGLDVQEDIKLDVQEAREAPMDHPQWEFEDDEKEADSAEEDSDDDYATDEDYDEED